MTHAIEPMICTTCNSLKDIVVGEFLSEDEYPGTELKEMDYKCSYCGTNEHLKKWDGKSCPKCGDLMSGKLFAIMD